MLIQSWSVGTGTSGGGLQPQIQLRPPGPFPADQQEQQAALVRAGEPEDVVHGQVVDAEHRAAADAERGADQIAGLGHGACLRVEHPVTARPVARQHRVESAGDHEHGGHLCDVVVGQDVAALQELG
jgi:hypothetical protein